MSESQEPASDVVLDAVQDVVIVGGGIAGLAAAASLAGSGLSVLLVEARELPSSPEGCGSEVGDYDPRVSALTLRSLALLKRLGAWSAIDARRHCPYRHMTVWDAEGSGSIDFDAGELAAEMLGTIVENRQITGALAEQVRRASNIELCAPGSLSDARALPAVETPPADSQAARVEIRLSDGTTRHCQLLIAADGALSPTRELFAFRTREWDYDHRAIVTTARFERSHAFTAWQRFLTTGPLALLPLSSAGETLCSIVWSIDEERADEVLALEDAAFCAALSEASEHRLGAVVDCAKRFAFPLRQRHAVDYVQPGVALVADAAHTVHPLAGQGINLGLADVEVLVEELLRAQQLGLPLGDLSVLRRYQRRRKGDNLAMMAAMDGFKHLFGNELPAVRWLRNEGLRQVGSLPALKRRIMRHAMGVGV